MYRATMSRTLSMNNGSVDNLKVSSIHGLSPNAFQMRLTVGWDIPVALAIPLVDQCVASTGCSVSVFTTTASTWSSVTVRGTPERCSSARPVSRLATNRDRHFPTVAWLQPNSAATTWFVLPSAQPNTILDRNARLCGLFGRRAQRPSVSRSSSERTRAALGRPRAAMRTSIVAHAEPARPTQNSPHQQNSCESSNQDTRDSADSQRQARRCPPGRPHLAPPGPWVRPAATRAGERPDRGPYGMLWRVTGGSPPARRWAAG